MAHSKTAKHRVVQWPVEAPDSPTVKSPTVKSPTVTEKTAGRISHDERGNAVFKRRKGDSTSTMLKRLELPDLKVEGQEDAPAPSRAAAVSGGKAQQQPQRRSEPGGGYNPYDQSRAVKKPTTPKGPVGRRTR
jgi:hypothetical protein